MLRKVIALSVFFLFLWISTIGAVEMTKDQFIRLVLDDATGNFSLYYLIDPSNMQYEPLFNDKDPAASFSEISVNGRVYRLGYSRVFETRTENHNGNPAIIHESSFLSITKVFFPVKTVSSNHANGIRIGITIKNKTNEDMNVGLRFLIDTTLGEGRGDIPFNTDTLSIKKEALVESTSGENYWISRGTRLSLMGNITSPYKNASKRPDFVHFANWKKLFDVPWKAPYYEGRSFTYTHYSVNDSAVCYYYEPDVLGTYGTFEYEIFLTTEDIAWYNEAGLVSPSASAPPASPQGYTEQPPAVQQLPPASPQDYAEQQPVVQQLPPANIQETEEPLTFPGIQETIDSALKEAAIYGEDPNLVILRRLQEVLDQFIAGEISLDAQDLMEVETSIERHGNR